MMHIKKIFGPPGTGKTTRLLGIMEKEIRERHVHPTRIAYLSFTVAARKEAVDRAYTSFGYKEAELPWFRTLHSTCFRLNGLNHASVVGGPDQLREFGEIYQYEFSYRGTRGMDEDALFSTTGSKKGDQFLGFYHWMHHRLLDFETAYQQWPDDLPYYEIKEFVQLYEKWKKQQCLLDFTDFLRMALSVEALLPCDVVIVDEAQDLSDLQWKTLWMIARSAKRVYVAGDDDQGIYSWSGANPEALVALKGTVADEVLTQSYRLPKRVHQIAISISDRIANRQPKEFKPREDDGEINYHSWLDSIKVRPNETYLFLVRNNYLKVDVAKHLVENSISYCDNGRPHVSPKITTSIQGWIDLGRGKKVSHAVAAEVYDKLTTGISVVRGFKKKLVGAANLWPYLTMLDLVNEFGLTPQGDGSWFANLTRIDEGERVYIRDVSRRYGFEALVKPLVSISTIHGAKGGEADNVVLVAEMATRCWRNLEQDPDSELRVWYVGCTRARHRLEIVGENGVI